MPRPVAISRDQILDLKFYGWLDIGLVVAVLATFAIGTLSVGWWRRRRARNSIVEDDSECRLYAEHGTGVDHSVAGYVGVGGSASSALRAGRSAATAGPPPAGEASTAAHRRAGDHGGIWLFQAQRIWVAGLAAVLTLVIALASAPAVASPGTSPSPGPSHVEGVEPLVLAHYYIWFTPGSWNRAKKDIPLAGRYSSDDIEVMRTHVRQAQAAGIDGFIVSWKSTAAWTRVWRT